MGTIGKAIAIASKAFEGKKDKGGNAYILHCLHVMNGVKHLGEHAMILAVLHDLVEDCSEWTFELLQKEGFGLYTITLLNALTKKEGEDYMDYIKRAACYPITAAIKREDLKHNSDITRLKGFSKKDFDRLEKYAIAYEYLKNI